MMSKIKYKIALLGGRGFVGQEIIKLIDIGDILVLENLIKDFKLLPVPEINTAVLILLIPVDRTI